MTPYQFGVKVASALQQSKSAVAADGGYYNAVGVFRGPGGRVETSGRAPVMATKPPAVKSMDGGKYVTDPSDPNNTVFRGDAEIARIGMPNPAAIKAVNNVLNSTSKPTTSPSTTSQPRSMFGR